MISRRFQYAARSLFLAVGLMFANLGGAQANDPDQISVQLDQAKLLKLPTGTDTIVVGNPAIADVAIQRNGVLVITGRAPGRTNFIALDQNGTIISESSVSVSAARGGTMIVQRGLDQSSYHCAPDCLPAVMLGDEDKHFNRATDQPKKRESLTMPSNQGVPRR